MHDEKLLERIRKLFAKAEDPAVVGTPEAEVFIDKAMALLAKYGIDETLARSAGSAEAGEIVSQQIVITGSYQVDQVHLVGAICTALHCRVVLNDSDGRRVCIVIGARRHTDRVMMLTGLLQGLMLSRAARTRSPNPGIVSTTAFRKSFMAGFSGEIARRLEEAESTAVDDSADAAGAELVLASDADRATAEMGRMFPRLGSTRRRKISTAGLESGQRAAADVDLGQKRMDNRQRALTA